MKPVPMIPARSTAGVVCDTGLLLTGKSNGKDDDRAADHLLLAGVQTGQDQAVVDQSNEQCAEVHWAEFSRGGHFAAMEAPDLLVSDVREFFRQFR
jgi:hypothetical protein